MKTVPATSISLLIFSQTLLTYADVISQTPMEQQISSPSKRACIQILEPPPEHNINSIELLTHALEPGEIALTDNHNTQYYGTFFIGNPNQKFDGILDTGSGKIWVPDKHCFFVACRGKEIFYPELSQSFSTDYQGLSIQYGSGSMQGYRGYDTVTLGDIPVADQEIGLATWLSDSFQNTPFDGIFGLAYKSPADDPMTLWMDNAVLQGRIPKAMFSFYLSNTPANGASRLIIGEPDPYYYRGEINWHPILSLNTGSPMDVYYNITFDGIRINDRNIPLSCQHQGNCRAIIDSGTSLIVGPANDVFTILNALQLNPDCTNLHEQPSLTFTIGGQNYTVPPEFYVVKQVDWWGQEQCVVGLAPGNKDFWILGDAFMRAFYVVFDKTEGRVGFARLAKHLSTPKALRKYFTSRALTGSGPAQ
ncbi:pepsin-like aspartyl protease [Endozoicomonas sp.]|uniref:pepsin-like aspartyl protease n=1 Tax=Endozoicomonas sp. TaxID=1892382 RepID=UPI0028874E13|nr:pepsin-like aspartyl protease [Endozoicomonas sp.]